MQGVSEHLSRFAADKILKAACERVGLVRISTYSFRRTALTLMKARWYPFAGDSEHIETQQFRDIAALLGSNPRTKT